MTDVVLVHAPVAFCNETDVTADQTSNPPIGLLYIAAYLEKYGISAKIVDPAPEQLSMQDVLEIIKEEQPKIVGISSMTPAVRAAYNLANAIKKEFGPKPFVGIGGIHVSVDPDFINRYPVFDFEVVGEGEITFYEIVRDILAGKTPDKIYHGKLIEDLDVLPFPARHLLKAKYYCPHDASQAEDPKPEITIISSRGCPFHCLFCSKPAHRNKYRFRSAKNIVDEMESVYDNCGGKFNFVDDTMGSNKEKAIEFCDEIINRELKVSFATQMRATDIDEDLVSKLAEAGCREAFFGVESGSDRVRNQVIQKMVPEKSLHKTVRLCRKYGIQSNFYLMLGFPTETKEDLKETARIGVRTKVDFIGIHITQVIPGSRLYEQALKEGKIKPDTIDQYIRGEMGLDFFDVFPKYIPDGLTIDDLKKARLSAYRKFLLNPGWIYRRIKSYYKHPDRFFRDCRTLTLGIYILIHGHTKSAAS